MSKRSPQRFGKYVLMRKIALGGMAEIFKAKMTGTEGFEKDLVIKRILPHFTEDESFVKMFIDEASITAKLQHPNIVQIFDFDAVDGTYYIAMEYIEGRDLKDVIERSIAVGDPVSVPQCVWILMEVAKGLHYAHVKEYRGKPLNIVHRDISPSNVMIAFNGDVKLMDFGIAKAAQRSTKTMAGAVKGKVAYMSPEQARGKPLDGRSDLFALGIMMWEMLTGRRLFLAESDFDTLTNVLKTPVPPPSSLNPAVPQDLEPIVLKCLEKDRDQRYPNVEAFARELTRWYYSNVIDLEKEKLKPLMHRLFKPEIDDLERLNDDERPGAARPSAPGLSAPASVSTVDKTNALMEPSAVTAGDATALLSAMSDPSVPLTEQRTQIYAAAADPPEPPGGVEPLATDARTRAIQAIDATQIHQPMTSEVERPGRRRSRVPLLAALVFLLVGGGGTASFMALKGGAGAEENPAVEAQLVGLRVAAEPPEARVLIEGEESASVSGLRAGASVRVQVQADGHEPYDELVTVRQAEQTLAVTLQRRATPHTFVIRPSDASARIFAEGRLLGIGPQSFTGRVGDTVTFRIEPSGGGEPISKVVTLQEDVAIVDVAVVTSAQLLLSVAPADAQVEVSEGDLERREPGLWAVTGLELGQSVDVTVRHPGHRQERQTVTIGQITETRTMELDRVAPAPVARGSLQIMAKPWAQIAINGEDYGTTPKVVDDLPAGRHTVVFTRGSQSLTRTVTVQPGRTVTVRVEMDPIPVETD